jgi:hypothetical protein
MQGESLPQTSQPSGQGTHLRKETNATSLSALKHLQRVVQVVRPAHTECNDQRDENGVHARPCPVDLTFTEAHEELLLPELLSG